MYTKYIVFSNAIAFTKKKQNSLNNPQQIQDDHATPKAMAPTVHLVSWRS